MRTTPVPCPILALVLCLALALGGCLPNRVAIDLAPSDGELAETEVLADVDAPGGLRSAPKVVLIDVQGLLSHAPEPGLIASRENAVDALVRRLRKAEDDPRVVGVILRINSPGGTVAATETMYREVEAFRARTGRPAVASMAEVAASGGYYLALACDHIVAQSTSITGSIGVLFQTFNFDRGMERLGIDAPAVTSGPNKDLANPFEPRRDEHYAILQGIVDEFYSAFRETVVARRPALSPADLDRATDGRVFTGSTAARIGLVDTTGGLREAFDEAKRLAGAERARLVKYAPSGREPGSAYALAAAPASANASAGVSLDLRLPASRGAGFFYLWAPGR